MLKPEKVGTGKHKDTKNGCFPICSSDSGGCGGEVIGEASVVYTSKGIFHQKCYEKMPGEFIENGIMYRTEDGKRVVVCVSTTCSEHQVSDHACWHYSEPTPFPGGEKKCRQYVMPTEEDLKKIESKEK